VTPAAGVGGASGDTAADAFVNCVILASGGEVAGGATVGSCPGGTGAPAAAGASGSTGDTDAGATAGCIGGGASTGGQSVEGAVGGCNEAASGGAGGTTPIDDGADGGFGLAGETASGGGAGVLASVAGASLPFTGLPVWMLAAAGFLALLAGGLLRRRHAPIA